MTSTTKQATALLIGWLIATAGGLWWASTFSPDQLVYAQPGIAGPTARTNEPAAPAPRLVLPVRVDRVIDGDTVDCIIEIKARVRLLDCWADERGTPKGDQATAHLVALTQGQRGLLEVPIEEGNALKDLFSFGRLLGRVQIEKGDLSRLQVQAGMATESKTE